ERWVPAHRQTHHYRGNSDASNPGDLADAAGCRLARESSATYALRRRVTSKRLSECVVKARGSAVEPLRSYGNDHLVHSFSRAVYRRPRINWPPFGQHPSLLVRPPASARAHWGAGRAVHRWHRLSPRLSRTPGADGRKIYCPAF